MLFLDRLRPDLVSVDPPWRTFRDTIAGLVASLVSTRVLPPGGSAAAIDAVLAREAEASTALLEIRAGVPHARLPGLRRTAVALAISPAGLYEAVPTVTIQIVALVLSPPAASTGHLETLADVATLLRSDELRAVLLAAGDGAEICSVLQRHARGNA